MYPFIDLKMSNKEYHSRREISNSDLGIVLQSPALLAYSKLHKKKQTPDMILGSLFHTLILQPELLDIEYAIEPEKKLMKECKDKAEWEAYKIERDNFEANAGGKMIIDIDMLATAKAMRDSLQSSITFQAIMKKAIVESSAFWIDQETGIPCRCRPDIAWDKTMLFDLKTTSGSAGYNEFRRTIVNWNYDMNAAHYLKGYSAATGVEYSTYVFIVIEKKPPYAFAFYAVNDAVVEAGCQLRKKTLDSYATWMHRNASGESNSIYPDEIQLIDMAAYGFSINDR